MSVAMALQAHAFAALHFRHIGQWEAQKFLVLAEHRHAVTLSRHANRRFVRGFHIENLFTGFAGTDQLALRHHKAIADARGDQQLACRVMHHNLDNLVARVDIHHQAHWVAMAAPAG